MMLWLVRVRPTCRLGSVAHKPVLAMCNWKARLRHHNKRRVAGNGTNFMAQLFHSLSSMAMALKAHPRSAQSAPGLSVRDVDSSRLALHWTAGPWFHSACGTRRPARTSKACEPQSFHLL